MSGSRYGESWTCATCGKQVLGEGPWGISPAIARHVAALQEIGKGVEADQATIARLSEELAQAERLLWAVVRHPFGCIGAECVDRDGENCQCGAALREIKRRDELARHRARRSAGEGREG